MNKIAILSCQKSATTCCAVDCLRFLAERQRSFQNYAGQEVQLAGFTTCCGCESDPRADEDFKKKMEHLLKAGVAEVHISACVTAEKKKCPQKNRIFEVIEANGMRICFLEQRDQFDKGL